MGFDGPFDTAAYPGRAGWLAAVDGPGLNAVWRDGLRWMEFGEQVAPPATVDETLRECNRWLLEWWGVSAGLLHGPAQTLTPKTRPSGAARAADQWGLIRWWRNAAPHVVRAARGY